MPSGDLVFYIERETHRDSCTLAVNLRDMLGYRAAKISSLFTEIQHA